MMLDRLDISLISIAVTVLLMVLRMPIGIALSLSAFGGIWQMTTFTTAIGIVRTVPYSFVATWELSAIPMFLLMGYIAAGTGITRSMFVGLRNLMRNVPGGLAVSSVLATTLFAASSGSSLATAAAMSKITVPEMLRAGYDKRLATGSIAAAGTLGSIIPPSIVMVIYGVFTGAPIGQLFMAGFLPGLLTAAAYIALIMTRVVVNPALAPRDIARPGEPVERVRWMDVWPLPVLILGVLGGIFAGLFSATEAGAVGAAFAFVIAAMRRSLSREGLTTAIVDTVKSSASIFMLAVGAALFQRLIALSQMPVVLSDNLLAISDNVYVIIFFVAVLYLVLGVFLDAMGLLLLTLPILLPVLAELDVNLIWFGIIIVKLLEVDLIVPPLGMNCFVIKTAVGDRVALPEIFKGVMWFVVLEFILLAVLVAFPQISLFLPSLMAG